MTPPPSFALYLGFSSAGGNFSGGGCEGAGEGGKVAETEQGHTVHHVFAGGCHHHDLHRHLQGADRHLRMIFRTLGSKGGDLL